jgi:ankyrin repeat protein
MTPLHTAVAYNDLAVVAAELERGADANMVDDDGYTLLMAAAACPEPDVEMLSLLLAHGAEVNASTGEGGETALSLAISHATPAKVEVLLKAGADINYWREGNYDALLDAMHSRSMVEGLSLLPLVELLLKYEAPVLGQSDHGESALSVASHAGRMDVVKTVLDAGGDATQLGWGELHFAVALDEADAVREQLAKSPDLEARDRWNRTPWLLAVQMGEMDKIELLHEAGGSVEEQGHGGATPLMVAAENGDAQVLSWLIEHGAQVDARSEYGETALMTAAQSGATECVRLLLAAGADASLTDGGGARALDAEMLDGFNEMLREFDPEFAAENPDFNEQLAQDMAELPGTAAIGKAANLEIVQLLVEAGEDLNDISAEMRAAMLGLETEGEIDCTPEEYLEDKYVYFGDENPEKIDAPFWHAMTRSGASAYRARATFEDTTDHEDDAVWSYQRFGKSITIMPDGRIIEIGGEHEDFYDPDFTIYNDVFVHHGEGNFDIYAYPEEVFPPTDFHTATLAGEHIYIIGGLGYPEDRQPGTTPVYRLDTNTYAIEKVETSGDTPGWISRHRAAFHAETGEIHVWGGGVYLGEEEDQEMWEDNEATFVLDLASGVWQRREESAEF